MKQLAMKFRSWGGKRRGAGRKPIGARPSCRAHGAYDELPSTMQEGAGSRTRMPALAAARRKFLLLNRAFAVMVLGGGLIREAAPPRRPAPPTPRIAQFPRRAGRLDSAHIRDPGRCLVG
ncbi:MAG TPA: hypothetical protein VFE76_02575 [Myxococcales bacterium]|nr:hypothetical protein [Myxococcales bacterium]